MNDYISLDLYNNSFPKKLKINYLFLLFILIISIFLLYILIFIKIDDYYINECLVKEDLLICSVKYDELKYIVNNNTLYIDNTKYKYEVYSLDEEFINNNGIYYKNINLDIALLNKNIDNNIINIKIKIYHNNLLDYLKEIIGGSNGKNK